MKIAIYSPYLDTAGGGEKYVLTIAEHLSKKESVDVLLDGHLATFNTKEIIKKNEQRHNLDLSKVNFIKAPIDKGNPLKKALFLKDYDLLIYNTDGSFFYSTAKRNIVHFQLPVENVITKKVWGKIKIRNWQTAIFNSKFTKDFIEDKWPINGVVVYPPVDTDYLKPFKKKKQIISVGRFDGYTRVKKQDFLIEAFEKLVKKGDLKDWSLHLAGGALPGDQPFVDELTKKAKDKDIFLHPNLDPKDLAKLYGESTIYWHAMGYQETNPIRFEHFGITTVEAMAAGCIPVVINKGGQVEIVENDKSGFLWDSEKELLSFSAELIKNKRLVSEISQNAQDRSKIFSKKVFNKKIEEVVYGSS